MIGFSCSSVHKKESKKQGSGEPLAQLAETASCPSWSPFHMSFVYFLRVGLPDAFKPAERDHGNSRLGFPPCGSKGLCLLSLFCGKETSEFLPKARRVQALSKHDAWVGCSLARLWAGNELVLAKTARAWPVEAMQCVRRGVTWFL